MYTGLNRNMWLAVLLCLWSVLIAPFAVAGGKGEDPFPLRCANLDGIWRAESGDRFVIAQDGCKQLRIKRSVGRVQYAATVKPDGSSSLRVRSNDWVLSETYRWNSLNYATVLIIDRIYRYPDYTLEEHVELQRIGAKVLTESLRQNLQRDNGVVQKHITQNLLIAE